MNSQNCSSEGSARSKCLDEQKNSKFKKTLPIQILGNRKLSFQKKWMKEFPWLLEKEGLGVLCSICVESGINFDEMNVFCNKGFSTWNKALERFRAHEKCKDHRDAILNLIHVKKNAPIENQLNLQLIREQNNARNCLLQICSAIKYLARQNLAIRGHDENEGNFIQLLNLLQEHNKDLLNWTQQKKSWISWKVQNEFLDIMCSEILKIICSEVQEAKCYSVIVDGTQDISGDDQKSICVRFVDKNFLIREEFLGFCALKKTTGAEISKALLETLNSLNLRIEWLRWQAYDGAGNMSGEYNGTQSHIKNVQPLADYVHCTAHASNLVAQTVATSSALASSAMAAVNELGALISRSGRLKAILKDIAISFDMIYNVIRPLCPTRFLVRIEPCRAVLTQFEVILETLEQVKLENPTALGLLHKLTDGNTILGLFMSLNIFFHLETLNKTLQGKYETISGALEATKLTIKRLENHRTDEVFKKLYSEAQKFIEDFNLVKISLPRQRRPPERFTGNAEPHVDTSAFQYYKRQYFAMLDNSIAGLKRRIFQEGMNNLKKLEKVLLSGKISDIIQRYPGMNYEKLDMQLNLFKDQLEYKSLKEATEQFKNLSKDVKNIFSEIEVLLKLLMTCPASTCEAERTFSALRRLKTYLRSTMSNTRLSCLAVCHIHKHVLDKLDLRTICNIFIERNDSRQIRFGKFA